MYFFGFIRAYTAHARVYIDFDEDRAVYVDPAKPAWDGWQTIEEYEYKRTRGFLEVLNELGKPPTPAEEEWLAELEWQMLKSIEEAEARVWEERYAWLERQGRRQS